ncbi:30S ribosomal protein S9 [Candidatus Roizmanbacteria bacterium CG22_combo_CG10-13_8_21_14_all_35_9]|uniref:30S ribosomal protein S9 n=4 Tax=Candidatus Roizmaniibacteriota TaxID=1752723 RepID=A0A2M8F4N6_9BACT|nr:MAG: 30S ribosomal protein S9 [Candidatus Roizmanbacteria bacterium CG23_combo_of_CG06-09_8_20_14_all_35_49]PIP62489.1 MAG: 30S ribosomal protein S9 [Candidatus Roizmanbacteria bacterium CG22_combo_CG10-13_8_21_14_all_35_9]PIY70852.1 MAG: 30S ribosomal protein S9 [Candidatus Roizmanbacteria bacterium CG_4_10_14_0_8_um_filter_35_28]PJC34263.1 MAG: 30S ribosomal protein S9 [Candidatus Roizmanbacteria bacterium CG_4_9_14_0_2_um_filter_35_15]PJC82593.1 MAG: 30S ribosomal protein S9 [Candidatus R
MAKKEKNLKYYEAVGRRKKAVARIRLYLVGKDKIASVNNHKIKAGEILINNHPLEKIINTTYERTFFLSPLVLTNNTERFAISILVQGGGYQGQLEAMVHGLARALELVDKETYRSILKKQGLLTRDARKRERRKVGTGGKARRKKQSPKR